jgi:hypothetical protein
MKLLLFNYKSDNLVKIEIKFFLLQLNFPLFLFVFCLLNLIFHYQFFILYKVSLILFSLYLYTSGTFNKSFMIGLSFVFTISTKVITRIIFQIIFYLFS